MTEREEVVLQRALGRLESKVDSILQCLAERARADESLELRVTALERWKDRSMGRIAGAGAVMAAVLGVLWRILELMK